MPYAFAGTPVFVKFRIVPVNPVVDIPEIPICTLLDMLVEAVVEAVIVGIPPNVLPNAI